MWLLFAWFLCELVVNDLWREEKAGAASAEQLTFAPALFFLSLWQSLKTSLESLWIGKRRRRYRATDCVSGWIFRFLEKQERWPLTVFEEIKVKIFKENTGLKYIILHLQMASFVGDYFLFLFPSVLLLLLSLTLRLPRVHCWTGLAVRALSWRLWVIICLILGLPLHKNTSARAEEVKSAGTNILSGSGQISDESRLICKPTALAKYLLRHCGSLAKPRLATWPRGDPHLQTLSSLLWGQHGEALQFTRDNLLLKDGGIIAVDWAVGTKMGEAATRKKWDVRKEHQSGVRAPGCFTSAPPVLLLIPQYWGGMTPHLKMLCQQALCQGFYVVVFHPRGTEGCPLTTARVTEFGDPADLEQVKKDNFIIKQKDSQDQYEYMFITWSSLAEIYFHLEQCIRLFNWFVLHGLVVWHHFCAIHKNERKEKKAKEERKKDPLCWLWGHLCLLLVLLVCVWGMDAFENFKSKTPIRISV